jgi:hypothetical protein
VPGAAALVPKALPVTDECDPMPPPRANAAAVERLTQRATQRTESFFMVRLLEHAISVTVEKPTLKRTCVLGSAAHYAKMSHRIKSNLMSEIEFNGAGGLRT